MTGMKEVLKQSTDRLVIAFGALVALLSLFKIEDIRKFDLQPHPTSYVALTVGIVFFFVGILLHVFEADVGMSFPGKGVVKRSNGYSVKIGKAEVTVTFGQIENVAELDRDSVVALPANEFFDDECMQDPKSSLGSFVLKHFGGKVHDLEKLIASALKNKNTELVEKEEGCSAQSYGVGTCVFLDKPLQTQWKIIFAAVTTKRAKQGLQAESRDVIRAVREIGCKMADMRADKLILPVIGSGHGGLSREAALTCLLIAFVELLRNSIGRNLRRVTIVVFQESTKSEPDLSRRQVMRALTLARSCCD